MDAKTNNRIKSVIAEGGARRSFRTRRGYAAVAVLASAGLLAACGSDDASGRGSGERTLTEVALEETTSASDETSESETTSETTTTTTEPTTETAGSGSGDYDGWADIDIAAAELETAGVSCEVVDPEMMAILAEAGIEGAEYPLALCDGDAVLMFPDDALTLQAALMIQAIMEPDEYGGGSSVAGDNWIMHCGEEDVAPCEATAECTGLEALSL